VHALARQRMKNFTLFQFFGKKKKKKSLLLQGAFDLFLVLECVDACTSVNSDVSDWSHGFVEMISHTRIQLMATDILGKKCTRLVMDLYILVMRSILPGVCNFSNNRCKVKCKVSLSFYGNTFFCHDGSHQLSRSNIEAGVIDPIQPRRCEHDLDLLGLAVVGVQDSANKTCFNWRPLFDRNADMR
jgi:hypothetical protein